MISRFVILLLFAALANSARVGESDGELDSHELDGWPFSSPDPEKERDKKLKADIAACAADPGKAVKNEQCEQRVVGDGLDVMGNDAPITGEQGGFQKTCCFKTWKCFPDQEEVNPFDHPGARVTIKTSTCRDDNFIAALKRADSQARLDRIKAFNAHTREWKAQFPGGEYSPWGISHAENKYTRSAHVRNQPEMQAAEYKNQMDRGFYKAVAEGGYMGSKPYKIDETDSTYKAHARINPGAHYKGAKGGKWRTS